MEIYILSKKDMETLCVCIFIGHATVLQESYEKVRYGNTWHLLNSEHILC